MTSSETSFKEERALARVCERYRQTGDWRRALDALFHRAYEKLDGLFFDCYRVGNGDLPFLDEFFLRAPLAEKIDVFLYVMSLRVKEEEPSLASYDKRRDMAFFARAVLRSIEPLADTERLLVNAMIRSMDLVACSPEIEARESRRIFLGIAALRALTRAEP